MFSHVHPPVRERDTSCPVGGTILIGEKMKNPDIRPTDLSWEGGMISYITIYLMPTAGYLASGAIAGRAGGVSLSRFHGATMVD